MCKLRYLFTTCPQTLSHRPSVVDGQLQPGPSQCRFCSRVTSPPCTNCLSSIIGDAAKAYREIDADRELVASIPKLDKDPRQDLALVIGTSLLKLSGIQSLHSSTSTAPLRDIHQELFLQAVFILDAQLKQTPSDNGLRLLLVQLYLLMGNASHAHQVWVPMDVKRTVQDALSPLFFDRISTLSPALFQGRRPLLEPLRSYFAYCLRDECPLKIWDAFSAGSYTSILDMSQYDERLRTSCTLAMTIVEEARAARSFTGKTEVDIADHPLLCEFLLPSHLMVTLKRLANIGESEHCRRHCTCQQS